MLRNLKLKISTMDDFLFDNMENSQEKTTSKSNAVNPQRTITQQRPVNALRDIEEGPKNEDVKKFMVIGKRGPSELQAVGGQRQS